MQTFLPFSSFTDSARILDRQRLGKQRVEAWQIYQSLTDPEYGWKSHPAVLMWGGCELRLLAYGSAICDEWIARGYEDNMKPRFEAEFMRLVHSGASHMLPSWFGAYEFHEAHRAMLWRKDPDYYDFFLGTFDDEVSDYWWPVKEAKSA